MSHRAIKDYDRVECLGYNIFADNLENLRADRKVLINTINQYSYCIAEQDLEFKNALQGSDILLPDGIGLIIATKTLKNQKIKKIAGADLHQFLLEKLDKEKGSCYYLGASPETLAKIKNRIQNEYSNIKVESFSPPYKARFSKEETQKMIEQVNAFQPDVLFVGMTAPKQEKWSYTNKHAIESNFICSIGAVFDFYAGTVKRPSKIWISLGLEWLGRLLKEPKRMWKRYIYYGFVFGFYLIKEKFNSWFKLGRYRVRKQKKNR